MRTIRKSSKPASKSTFKKPTKDDNKIGYFQKDKYTTTIYVGNLSYKKNEKEVMKMFSKFGTVKYVRIVQDKDTGKNKGIAFVQMPNAKAAKTAIESLNGTQVDGRTLKTSIASERDENKLTGQKRVWTKEKPKQEKEEIIEPVQGVRRRDNRRGLNLLMDSLKK